MSRRQLSQAEADALGKEIDKEIDYHLRPFMDKGSISKQAGNKIMGSWIFRKDRWVLCVQTMDKCYERHALGKGDCDCRLCRSSKKWPELLSPMLQKFVPGGWQGDS